jgi:hypothetical protein
MAKGESIDLGRGFRLRKRGWSYHTDFNVGGKRYRRCLKTASRSEATAKAYAIRAPLLTESAHKRGNARGNVRLVCLCVNIALSQWGDGVFSLMAKGYVKALLDHPSVSPECVTRWDVENRVTRDPQTT